VFESTNNAEFISNFEYILRRKDTDETWWGSYSFTPIRDKTGRVIGSVVVGCEIVGLIRNR